MCNILSQGVQALPDDSGFVFRHTFGKPCEEITTLMFLLLRHVKTSKFMPFGVS